MDALADDVRPLSTEPSVAVTEELSALEDGANTREL